MFANIVFKANISNNQLPFAELYNPENLRKEGIVPYDAEWGLPERLQNNSALPALQSVRFKNGVIFSITSDAFEIKKETSGIKNEKISITSLISSAKKTPKYLSKENISTLGIGCGIIIECERPKEILNKQYKQSHENNLEQVNYRLVYNTSTNNSCDKINVDIFSGRVEIDLNPYKIINGIIITCGFNRTISDHDIFPIINNFIENIENYYSELYEKSSQIINALLSNN